MQIVNTKEHGFKKKKIRKRKKKSFSADQIIFFFIIYMWLTMLFVFFSCALYIYMGVCGGVCKDTVNLFSTT